MSPLSRSAVVLLLSSLLVVIGSLSLREADIQATTQEYMAWVGEQARTVPELSGPERDLLLKTLEETFYRLARGAIGITVAVWLGLGSLLLSWIRWGTGSGVRPRPSLARFAPWDGLVWVLILALLLVIVDVGQAGIVGWNLSLFLAAVFWIRGLGVLDAPLARRRVPLLLRGVALTGLLLSSFSFLFLPIAALGLFDTWFDFRRLGAHTTGTSGPPSQGG
jgi:hypothetical protein